MPQSIISQFQRQFNSPIEVNRQVATATERDAINSSTRWEGMLVYVIADGVTYELVGGISNGDWQILGGLQDAPSDNKTYGRRNGAWAIISGSATSGTWTPELVDNSGGATYTMSVASGQWVKSGNMVFINAVMSGINTSGTPTGFLLLQGLPQDPFTFGSATVARFTGGDVDFYSIVGEVNGVSNNINFRVQTSLGSELVNQLSAVTITAGVMHVSAIFYVS